MSARSIVRWPSRVIGAFGALAVHALMLQAVSLGTSAAKQQPERETGPGASAIVSGADASMTLVLVQLPSASHSDVLLQELASRGAAAANAAIQVVSPDPTPAFDVAEETDAEADPEAPQSVGDPAMRSMLFGRYTGQINARIQRAWLKPRSAVNGRDNSSSLDEPTQDARFHCAVRITQDARGFVQEVELVQCNGTLAWQYSLISAIQRSSPLPAPPSPTVFTNALILSFEGQAYRPGDPDPQYEPETGT